MVMAPTTFMTPALLFQSVRYRFRVIAQCEISGRKSGMSFMDTLAVGFFFFFGKLSGGC